MKGKKSLLVVLPFSVGMILAACSTDKPDQSSSSSSQASSVISSSPISSSTSSSSSKQESSSSQSDPVTHRAGLNKALAEGAITRNYDERFDTIIEDFSGESMLGNSDGVVHKAFLREVVDSDLESFQITPDSAIYKMASAAFGGDKTLIGQSSINFKMRVASGKLSIKDLILGIRPSDDNSGHVYPINLADALDSEQEALPELTNEFQTISISVSESVGDEDTLFPGTQLKVLSEATGFHLYVKSEIEVSAVVEIAEVSYSKGDSTVVIDDFNRTTVTGNPNVYWGPTDCADSVLIRKGVEISNGKKYTTPVLNEKQRGYSHIVFEALGDMSGSNVEIAYDDDSNTVKTLAFKDLKAKTDKAVVNTVDGIFAPIAIDLSVFAGPTDANIKTVTIKNDGKNELMIANVFGTSFEEPVLDKKYPNINTETAVTFDNFERDITSLDADWDASAANEKNIAAGINGFVSYSNGANISTSEGALHLPGVSEGYDEVTIGSSHTFAGAQYLVFSIKGEEGADLSTFRFEMGSASAIWFNSAMAMEGVRTYGDADFASPYVTEDGYTWYVVDLNYHNVKAGDLINIYYSGEKDISISSIFYANSFSATKVLDGWADTTADVELSGYKYAGNVGKALDAKYIGFTVKGDGTDATLATFRFELNGETKWINKDEVDVYDAKGSKVDEDTVIPEEDTTYYVDISTFPTEGNGMTHIHVGGDGAGKVTFANVFAATSGISFDAMGANDIETTEGCYAYCGGWKATAHADKIYVAMSSEDSSSDLSQFRVEAAGKTIWAKDNAELLKNVDGSSVVLANKLTSTPTTVVIDLKAAGIAVEKDGEVHLHNSQDTAWKLALGAATAYSEEIPYSTALASYVETWLD